MLFTSKAMLFWPLYIILLELIMSMKRELKVLKNNRGANIFHTMARAIYSEVLLFEE